MTGGPAMKAALPSEQESHPMFIAIAQPAVEPQGPDSVAVPCSPLIPELSPRALHARLLENAALRRPLGVCISQFVTVLGARKHEGNRPTPVDKPV